MPLTTAQIQLCFTALEKYRPPEGVDTYSDANLQMVIDTKNALRAEAMEAQSRESAEAHLAQTMEQASSQALADAYKELDAAENTADGGPPTADPGEA